MKYHFESVIACQNPHNKINISFSDNAVGGLVAASPCTKVRPRVLPPRDRVGAYTGLRGAGTNSTSPTGKGSKGLEEVLFYLRHPKKLF